MDNPLVISLVVTGIGMLMLFLALAVLYGLMHVMTRITNIQASPRERPEAEEQGGVEAGENGGARPEEEGAMRRKAAVIAVALARAEGELGQVGAPGAGEPTSAWRALYHQRQLARNPRARRVR